MAIQDLTNNSFTRQTTIV